MSAGAQVGLCPNRLSRGEVAEEIVAQTVRHCAERHRRRLRGVILTGSLAREEATILPSDSRCRVSGDAEFLLVFKRRAKLPSAVALDSLARCVAVSLRDRKIICPVHLAAVHPRYFSRLPAHIFSYELRHAGRVVFGDETILRLAPDFPPGRIEREDAWRLLSNRLIEWLEAKARAGEGSFDPDGHLFYATVKLWLDAATSLLIFRGHYEPSYAARAARLADVPEESAADLPFPWPQFQSAVADATAWKLDPENFPLNRKPRVFCEEARRFALQLWSWELARMTGLSDRLPPLSLCGAFARRATPRQRNRGWLRVAREAGARNAWRHRRRWARLRRGGSPRHWLYAVAAECALREEAPAAPQSPWARTLRQFLPVPGAPGTGQKSEWRALILDLAWNYHEFVERTRA